MFIAMNRFKVKPDAAETFEQIWKSRDSKLAENPGFVEFHLLRGPENTEENYVLYASHTLWKSREDFENWTRSQNFRDAHGGSGAGRDIYVGHPQFEGFSFVEGA